jgi:hypothetical protein
MPTRDPLGKRALFSDPNTDAPEPEAVAKTRGGKKSLYSTAERTGGTVVLECSACHSRSRVSYLDFAIRQLPVSFWTPWRHFSRFMTCPACGHRTWLAARWFA